MDSSWIDNLCRDVSTKVISISEIWNAIGIEGVRLQARKETLAAHVLSMLDEMHNEEVTAQQALSNSIEELKSKIQELETELGLAHTQCTETLSLVALEKALFDQSKTLEEKAAEIRETCNNLRKEEELLASRLDEPTTVVIFCHAPNQDQLNALKANIDFLTMEKRHRILELSEMRQEILNLDSVIGLESLNCKAIIAQLLAPNALEVLPLSKAFLTEVKDVRCKGESLLLEVRDQCDRLSEDILKLADRLNIAREDLVNFDQPTSSVFLTELKKELERLTELRRQNLAVFIHNCQVELRETWDACRLSETERDFSFLRNDHMCTELMLEQLEEEIAHWKQHYISHEDVFRALDSWHTAFVQFCETEAKKKDPIILKNRGGILLVVEKQFKQLQREMKRLESIIQQFSVDPKHVDLRVHGMSVMEFLEATRRQREEDKENEAQKKKMMQTRQLNDASRSTSKRTVNNKRLGDKTIQSGSRNKVVAPQAKKPRLEFTKVAVTRTPTRQFIQPSSVPPRSARKPGGMTSTPRHSREFLL